MASQRSQHSNDTHRRIWEDVAGDWGFDDVVGAAADSWWTDASQADLNAPPPFLPDSPPPLPSLSRQLPTQASSHRTRDDRFSAPRPTNRTSLHHAGHATSSHHQPSRQEEEQRPAGLQQARQLAPTDRSDYLPDRDLTRDEHEVAAAFDTERTIDPYTGFDNAWNDPFPISSDYSSWDIDQFFAGNSSERHPAQDNSHQVRSTFVDLTDDMPSPPMSSGPRQPISLRRAYDDTSRPRSNKRRRTSNDDAGVSSSTRHHNLNKEDHPIEELDLTNEAPSAEEELAQTQQAALLASQADASSDKPLKLGQRTCIICMEPFTNATVTSCGHMYCHECLTQALQAGEKASDKGVGTCPVCRKPLRRNAKAMAMVPVAFMKKSAFKGKARAGVGVYG